MNLTPSFFRRNFREKEGWRRITGRRYPLKGKHSSRTMDRPSPGEEKPRNIKFKSSRVQANLA
jgi:hypothetical protein